MSCVPSINAFVATHSCHNEETEKEYSDIAKTVPVHIINEPEKDMTEGKSWLGSIMDKFVFVGHDGVGLAHTDASPPFEKSSLTDVDKNNNAEKGAIDILSRVRHLSGETTLGNRSDLASPSNERSDNKSKRLLNPES